MHYIDVNDRSPYDYAGHIGTKFRYDSSSTGPSDASRFSFSSRSFSSRSSISTISISSGYVKIAAIPVNMLSSAASNQVSDDVAESEGGAYVDRIHACLRK